ncbi:MAG: ACT domain-containing protein [Gammaproteobacteria bacterium]|nr:ACT domain-containing protein [Gammaproteobacteria bacterium]
MKKWSLITLVGADQAGIVAQVTQILAADDCELGETSMVRMGGSFSMMLRVRHDDMDLGALLKGICESLNLHLHVDEDVASNCEETDPDVNITVYGADRSGIVAEVTAILADAGLNIIDLETAVAGTADKPIYIMTIEGQALQGVDALTEAAKKISKGIELNIVPIQTLRA